MLAGLKPLDTTALKRIGTAPKGAADESIGLDAERVFRQRFERHSFHHAAHVRTAADVLDHLPDEGEVIHVLMAGRFHGWDFVPAVLKLAAPATIHELYIATLGFNDANSGELLGYLDAGTIRRVWFLASCYMRDASAHLFEPLVNSLTKRGQTIKATRNHAKLLAMKLSDGRHIVVDGSMNLRSCRNVEQANVWQSRELFNWYAAYVRDQVEGEEHVK